MTKILINLINYVLEMALTLLLLSGVSCAADKRPRGLRRVLGVLCLLALLPLFVFTSDAMLAQYVRLPYRLLCYAAFFALAKGMPFSAALYNAAVLACVHTAYINIWTIPVIFRLAENIPALTGLPSLDALLLLCIFRGAIYGALLLLLKRCFSFDCKFPITQARIFPASAALLSEAYVKETLFFINKFDAARTPYISIYIISFSLFVLGFLFSNESNLRLAHEREALRSEELSNRYRIQNLQIQQENTLNTRRIYHDMKNHLHVLEQLSQEGASDDLRSYISDLIGELSKPPQLFQTGSSLLDGILADKAEIAKREGIAFSVSLSLESNLHIRDLDMCTIFGNALDNAIEAAKEVSNPEQRLVQIRGLVHGSYFVVSFSNAYDGALKLRGGQLLSTKRGFSDYGVGIENISRAVANCGATMAIDTSTPRWFKLTVLFPCGAQDTEPTGEAET